MLSKKAEEELLRDLDRSHSLFQTEIPMHPLALNADVRRCGSVLVYPLFDDIYQPYLQVTITPESEYQKEVIKYAVESKRPIFLVPQSQYMDSMSGDIVATKFKGCKGIIAWPVSMEPSPTADDKDAFDGVFKTGFQCQATGASWESVYAVANVVPEILTPLPNTDEQHELSDILESRFSEVTNFLMPESRTQLMQRLNAYGHDTLERLGFMIQNSPLDNREQESVLVETNMAARRESFLRLLSLAVQKLEMRDELNRRTMQIMSQRQRTEYLRNHIKTLQQELGVEGDEMEEDELRGRAQNKEWSDETRQAFDKEMRKLLRYAPNSPEYAMQYSYLDTFLNLPWQHCDRSVFKLKDVEEVLNRDHYGLDKVKERIIEQMAVLMLRDDMKAPILCLVGPPGVGKTSLGKSVAEALGRKYVRVALGGVHDEAEIRGHRRTYLGSMPGRIISALEKCGTSDPVMVLDEIDKLGADYKGDPSTALLEVLDPEQNSRFHDNYIDHDYDLSNILFIATANSLDTVSQPLLDRMEIIEIEGYVEDEKVEIAKRHLVGRNLERHGFRPDEMTFGDDAIREIINYYTRESGVRQLEKRIAQVIRKQARKKANGEPILAHVTALDVRDLLGRQTVFPDMYEDNSLAGVVTGLAWTQAGGEILFIEASVSEGKDGKLTLTGNLGDVMKESAILARQYLKANADKYGLSGADVAAKDLHIHVPEGAIPKDGPSAGITMLTAIASAFTGRKVRERLAMTGELTLRGKVLPVGGIKEKILAAKRAGISEVILSEKNRKDIEEIPSQYIDAMKFHFVGSVAEVLDLALLDERAE